LISAKAGVVYTGFFISPLLLFKVSDGFNKNQPPSQVKTAELAAFVATTTAATLCKPLPNL